MIKMILFLFTFSDSPEVYQLNFQNVATPTTEIMIFFHHYLMFFLIFMGSFVFWVLFKVIVLFNNQSKNDIKNITQSNLLEFGWTMFPAGILLFLAVPSFSLLYSLDELIDPSLTLKIVGHQWYWTYEYSDFSNLKEGQIIAFDSYMIDNKGLAEGSFRLLEVDNKVVLPTDTHIRLLITSSDVLHSWTVPSFGIKSDPCPGRLSQASLFLKRAGVYYGQCSEICGVNHGFMPIVVKGIVVDTFVTWLTNKIETLILVDSKFLDQVERIEVYDKPLEEEVEDKQIDWVSWCAFGFTIFCVVGSIYFFFLSPQSAPTIPPVSPKSFSAFLDLERQEIHAKRLKVFAELKGHSDKGNLLLELKGLTSCLQESPKYREQLAESIRVLEAEPSAFFEKQRIHANRLEVFEELIEFFLSFN
jgi:cytochrome c oxidase subunit 2